MEPAVLEVLLLQLVHRRNVVLKLGVHLDEPLLELVQVQLEPGPRVEHLLEDEVDLGEKGAPASG